MKRFLLFITAIISIAATQAQAPCNIQAFVSPVQIQCGDSAVLSAFGNGAGNVAFQEDFNSGSPVGWQFTQTVTIANNTCGVPSPDGTNFMWMGDASVNPRDMTTVPFDLTLGGVICFEMRYAIQGQAAPCEGPDEPQEGVYVQYSIDNGATWQTIQYWDPQGGNNNQLTSWNQYCVVLPAVAQTTSTMIRWHQDNVSGAEYDHWGIDNVVITLNDPNYGIVWAHDGYSYGLGNGGGDNPNVVKPTTTTTYTVNISDGTNTCTDQVQLVVIDPVYSFNLQDTAICPGDCITINAEAVWQIEPAGPKTFVNDISQTISAGFGGSGSTIDIPIVTSGINIGTLGPNDVLEVCITGMSYFGINFLNPNAPLDVGSFSIKLECPGGTTIELVPSGVTTSTAILPGYVNTCFSMSATNNISTGTTPYTGNFVPSDPLSDLAGCLANGTWTMKLETNAPLGFGSGNFDGWSITFDDPGKTAPISSFSWSPTTDMTNSNTLTPTICPTQPRTYTLTATNAPGCVSGSANMEITFSDDCCDLKYDTISLQHPDCGASNGQITIAVTGQIAGLQFSIDGGNTWQTSNVFSGLSPNTYAVVARDNNNCPIYRNVVLSNPNTPVLSATTQPNTSCSSPNGQIEVVASAGMGAPYTYSLNSGTPQSSGTFSGLGAGTFSIRVTDSGGCQKDTTVTVDSQTGVPTLIFSVDTVPEGCFAGGSAAIHVASGAAPYSYSWSIGTSTDSVLTDLGAGTYWAYVQDGCTKDSVQFVITKSEAAPVSNLPNIFTPNGDGVNDVYSLGLQFQNTSNFLCHIYNRWGNVMYKTEDKAINWAPTNVSDGVYFIVCSYTDCVGKSHIINGTLTVIAK